MNKTWLAAVAALTLAPSAAWAANAFDGTWKFDTKSAHFPTKPDVYLLQGGVFACKSCAPPYEVKVDDRVHPVSGSPYYDSLKVKVVDAHMIKGERMKGGKLTGRVSETVSPDGNLLTVTYDDMTIPSQPVTGTYTAMRVGPAPAGAHAVSGAWRQNKISAASENSLFSTFMVKDGVVHFSMPSGQSYVAKLGGPQAPYKGDPGVTSVAVTSDGPSELTETDYRDGKAITVLKMTVAPDGKSFLAVIDDKLHDATGDYTFIKQ